MSALDDKLANLNSKVEAINGVVPSAIAAFAGRDVIIADLRTQLENSGATAEQLAMVDAASDALEKNREALAQAIAVNP